MIESKTINGFRLVTDEDYAKARLADAILAGEVTISVSEVGTGALRRKVIATNLFNDMFNISDSKWLVVDAQNSEKLILESFIKKMTKGSKA